MFRAMMFRQLIIESLLAGTFLFGFHKIANDLFQMFVVFALFAICINTRISLDIAEIRAQGYLGMRMINTHDHTLSERQKIMEKTFDAPDLMEQFTEEKEPAVAGQQFGKFLGASIIWLSQAWMIGVMAFTVLAERL